MGRFRREGAYPYKTTNRAVRVIGIRLTAFIDGGNLM
jgi:hypothetical protein